MKYGWSKIKYALSMLFKRLKFHRHGCPSCGSFEFTKFNTASFVKFPTELRFCSSCFLAYRFPGTSEEESKRFYEKEYFQSGLTTELPQPPQLESLLETHFCGTEKDASQWYPILELIYKALGRKLVIFDYGANWGYTAWQFSKLPFVDRVLAFEYSDQRRRFGESNLKVEYVNDMQDMAVDLVFSSHVIEHMHDPSIFFKHTAKVLRKDGFVILTCPNGSLSSWKSQPEVYRAHWGKVHPNFISDQYLISMFSDYFGAVFAEPELFCEPELILNSLGAKTHSYLPTTTNLACVVSKVIRK